MMFVIFTTPTLLINVIINLYFGGKSFIKLSFIPFLTNEKKDDFDFIVVLDIFGTVLLSEKFAYVHVRLYTSGVLLRGVIL